MTFWQGAGDLFVRILMETWHLLEDAGVFVLLGLAFSAVIRVYVKTDTVARHLGGNGAGSVAKAALFGIPLPICSCGVLPAALSLRKQGAGKGACLSFLISTPESGADSIAVTYALLGPIFAVVRPIAAFATAVAAGLMENWFNPEKPKLLPEATSCTCGASCCGKPAPGQTEKAGPPNNKWRSAFRFAYREVWGDMALWFMAGLFLAGALFVLVPESWASRYLGGGIGSMAVMLVFGAPIYVCATSSTPIAAAMLAKGVSPGAALVFLLAGPATNAASVTVLAATFGKRTTAVYLSAIALVSVGCGLALDAFFAAAGLNAASGAAVAADFVPDSVKTGGAVILLVASLPFFLRFIKNGFVRLQKAVRNRYRKMYLPCGCLRASGCTCTKHSDF